MSGSERVKQALLDGMVDARVPGLAAAARLPSGEIVEFAIGARGVDNPSPMTVDTQFWIASCTKALTATAALQLVEDGLIGLDDPVGGILPGLASPKLLKGFDAAGQAILEPATRSITLRHLLSHTNGVAYGFCSASTDRYITAAGLDTNGPDMPDLPLMFEPGQGWVYGLGLDWAAKLIEALSGETFEAYMRRRVLAPLGMHDTGFFPNEEQQARTASMHARTPDGGLAPIPFALPPSPHSSMGGGGLYSTVGDYMKFMESMLGAGPRILKPTCMASLCANQLEGRDVGILKSAVPQLTNDFDPFPGAVKGWSLGFVSNLELGPNGRSAGSLAWAGLGNCYYWIDRQAGVAGIMCAQLLPFADPGVIAAFGAFERAVYAD